MVNVDERFHALSIASTAKTRCRIYFIQDSVNCWDDADVQTNGTLLVGAAGDTDSNGRIGQDGVTINEIFNKDQNISIGGTVSYQIGLTVLNGDRSLDSFAFGRCKVYIDVWDDTAQDWLACPMGVYKIDLPVKRRVQLISCSGYDQMQVLNAIADTWWNGLNFTGGLTIANILNSMVTQLGLHLSATSSTYMVNTTLSFTTPPIDSVERTYRDILGWIAEATATVAHFNRDGELDMRPYLTPLIGGNNIVIDTDTTGNQCLSIDVAEYQVAQIDALTIKLTTADQGVTVGSGTNVYTIMDNPFLYGPDVATIQNKLTPIYNRLRTYVAFAPISTRLIYDWSIEAGDIIYIRNNSTTYNMPIFQQKMTWRGGYVTSELISSGDTVRPQVSSSERETYRYNVEMATKVGDNEIISKINQTAEQIQIQASKVDLTGYVTFTNLSTDGQTSISGGNITTGTISADRIAAGSLSISKLDSATQNTITTAASDASTALSDAAAAQSTANSANSQEQLIYISKPSGTTTQSGTTTWVTDDRGYQNGWTIKRPVYSPNYPVLFVATQRKSVGGTITCTTPQIDNTTTVIDGGHITTGTIDAGVVNVTNINASNITSGTMSANKISGGTLTVGGVNNENGKISILDSGGIRYGEIYNNGIILYDAPNRPNNVSLVLSSIILGRDMYQTIRTQLDYMAGLIILNDANGTARVRTSGADGYLGLGDGTRERFIVAPSSGLTRWYDENGNLRIEFYSSSAGDYAQFLSELRADDVTINGVFDVTQRRASASLSSAGWYRVLTFDAQTAAQAQGGTGLMVDFNIVRWGSSSVSEQHKITLYSRFNGLSFDSEISRSSTQLIDKIRYNYGTDDGYVDIHYTGTSANEVTVYYDTYIDPTYQGRITSSGLAIVAESPSGETAGAASYTFGGNVPDSGTGYLKQADGTLIQWGTVTGLSFSAQNLISGTENLPVSFANTSYIVQASAITTGVNQYLFRCGAYPHTVGSFDWVLGSGDSSNITIANRGFVWTAIGRWK